MAFDPVSLGITVGTSLIGAVGSMFEAQALKREEDRRKQRARSFLHESMVSESELDKMLQNTDRLFNNRLVGTLNQTALRSRGVANASVVSGAVAGQVQGQRLEALTNIESQALAVNTQAQQQLAQLELGGGQTPDPGSAFLTGAIAGLPAGIELAKLASPQEIDPGQVPKLGEEQGSPKVMGGQGLDAFKELKNRFMGKTKISDDDINNLYPTALQSVFRF